jgi:hypothetical protein
VLIAVAGLAVAGLVRCRASVRARWMEAVTYLLLGAGVVLLVGVVGYRYRATRGYQFEQLRYLLPLLPLYALTVVLAARAFGRRWGPAAAAVLVVLAMGHTLFAMLLSISRYYA